MATIDHTYGSLAFSEAMRINKSAKQLTMQPSDWRPSRLPQRNAIELKYDGIPLLAGLRGRCSRNGAQTKVADHISDSFDELRDRFVAPTIFHGEYVNPAGFDASVADFQRDMGTGCFMIFDAVPLAAYAGAEQSPPLIDRYGMLQEAFDKSDMRGLYIVKQSRGFTVEGVEDAFGAAVEEGAEGIVLKDLDSPYIRQNSPFWQRLKRIDSIDLEIIETIEHTSGDKLGCIVCNHGGQPVRVFSGFSDKQRVELWRVRESLIGRIAEIQYRGLTSRKRLRSASFFRFRDDK